MSAIHLPSSDFPARRANMEYVCTGCGSRHGVDELLYTCPECGGVLLLEDLDFDALAEVGPEHWRALWPRIKSGSWASRCPCRKSSF